MQFWHELDRVRLRIYEGAVRPYLGAVRKVQLQQMPITDQHASRIKCAERYLASEPLRDFGVERMIAEARQSLSELVNPAAMQWLPDVRDHFTVGS